MKQHRMVINTIPLLSDFTGIAKYTHEISRWLREFDTTFNSTYYYGYFRKKLFSSQASGATAEVNTVKRLKGLLARNYIVKKLTREGILYASQALAKEWDLYWEPNIVPIRQIRSKHLVTTVHDFSFHRYPEWHPRERTEYFQKRFWKNIGKSDRIITGSHFTRNEIGELLRFDPSRVQVIYHGVDHDNFKLHGQEDLKAFADLYHLPEKFLLFVGSIEPRKNLKNALLAYNALPDAFKREYKFLLAGFSGWNNAEVMEIICREKGNIIYLGYLSDREIAYLYNLASLFIYPTLYEGFGLPPLEAMACGTPVIVSRAASLPEICGDAALYIDPLDRESISQGMLTVLGDGELQQRLIRRGLDLSGGFSWDRSARSHLALFQEVMEH